MLVLLGLAGCAGVLGGGPETAVATSPPLPAACQLRALDGAVLAQFQAPGSFRPPAGDGGLLLACRAAGQMDGLLLLRAAGATGSLPAKVTVPLGRHAEAGQGSPGDLVLCGYDGQRPLEVTRATCWRGGGQPIELLEPRAIEVPAAPRRVAMRDFPLE
ncbi:MAG: hypothetical protein OHK0024_15750 [Thalassobaculales bacterium]